MRKKTAGVSGPALSRFALRARRAAGVRGTVDILITNDEEIRELNRRFRQKNQPTDVLAFPAVLDGTAGEIAISADIAARNARRFGHRTAEEVKILVLHGMLHLAGYDHEDNDVAVSRKMARKEERLRRRLRLPSSLISRSEIMRASSSESTRRRKKA